MEPTFELTAVYATNIFGIVLLAVLIAGNVWRFRERGSENAYLQLLLFFTFCTCVLDPIAYTADGRPGTIARIFVYGSNELLYLTNMFSGVFWLLFLAEHLNYRFSTAHRNVLGFSIVLGLVLVILNNFVPIIFDISANNVYTRRYFWIYTIIDYGLLLDSLIIYLICKHRGGPLKSFPVWIFFFPIIAGTVAQSLFYGISAISSCTAIAIAGVFSSIHGERVYRDKLTNVYNYAYLAILSREYKKKKKDLHVTGILVNVNSFKKINQNYGRVIGNRVLTKVTKVLNRAVGELGIIVRYSSDEFIAFINTTNEIAVSMCITRIKAGLNEVNTFSNSYKLTTCICSQSYDTSKTMDDFIDEIMRSMQEEKTSYYTQLQYNHRDINE